MTHPYVTVVVPTHGRPKQLERCLDALAAQECGFPFEVTIVDDGSPSPVVTTPRNGLALQVVRISRSGPAAARNVGVTSSEGDLLAFTDDDCRPPSDWLANLARAIEAHPDALVAGVVDNGLRDNIFAQTSQDLVSYLVSYYENGTASRFFTSNNFGTRRSTFDQLGGFDGHYTRAAAEDRELCARALDEGFQVVVDENVRVAHHHDLSTLSFLRQHYQYGRGAHQYHLARRAVDGRRSTEPTSFYIGLTTRPLRSRVSARTFTISSLLAVSQVAHAVGYVVERSRPSSNR